jgi:hypothetical protein
MLQHLTACVLFGDPASCEMLFPTNQFSFCGIFMTKHRLQNMKDHWSVRICAVSFQYRFFFFCVGEFFFEEKDAYAAFVPHALQITLLKR